MNGKESQAGRERRSRAGLAGLVLVVEAAVIVVLLLWMRVNAAASTGGFPFSNGGLFFQQPRAASAAELATHGRLAFSVVAVVVVAGVLTARERRWKLLVVQVLGLMGVVYAAGALAP